MRNEVYNNPMNTKDNRRSSHEINTDDMGNALHNINDALIILDKGLNILFINKRAQQFTKKNISKLVRHNLLKVFPQVKKTPVYSKYKKVLRTRKPENLEMFYSPVKKWYKINIQYYKKGLLIFYHDITEQKALENEMLLQNERLHLAQKISRVGTFEWDIKKNKLFWSKEEEDLFDISSKDLSGSYSKWTANIHPEDIKRVKDEIKKCIDKHKLLDIQFRVIHRNKKIRWLLGRAETFYDEKGKPSRMLGVNMDITKQKRIENILKESEEQFRSMADSAPIMMWLVNLEKMTYYFNKKWLDFRGKTLEEEAGSGWVDAIFPEDLDRITKISQNAFDKREPFEMEYRLQRWDGEYRWVLDSGAPRYTSNGSFLGYTGICIDIDERKHIEDSLKFKSEATRVLSLSLDYNTTLKTVARIAIPRMADWCTVDMINERGEIELLAISHKDPSKVRWAKELRKSNPVDTNSDSGVGGVLRNGKTAFFPNITDEMLIAGSKTKKQLALARKIGIRSMMIVPIKAENKSIGAITFISAESKRQYTETDRDMAEQLATRASLAIENSKLYSNLQEQKESLINTITNVPGIVWEAYRSPDIKKNRANFVSNYVEKMIGYTPEEWLNTPHFWRTIIHPDDQIHAVQVAEDLFKTGKEGINQYRWITKEERIIYVEAYSSPIKDSKGKVIGMRGVAMDVTARVEIEKRKDDFISMASHELKTPLTSLKAYTQLLEKLFEKEGDKTYKSYIGKMDTQVNKLTELIKDLLDLTKIQAGKLAFNMSKFNINSILKETVETIQQISPNHKINLTGKATAEIWGDQERISQVIINLLTNAVKYSPNSKKINIKIDNDINDVHISVQDFGIGIAKKDYNRIFDRFYRVSDSEERTFPGLGIGLYISLQIAFRHGGSITVDSVRGKGSTFHLYLPIKNHAQNTSVG